MAPRGGGCLYFIMEWPGIIRSGLFLSLYNQWLAGSWGDVLIRVKRCENKDMRIFCTILTRMIVLQRLVRGGEAGAGAGHRQRDRWVLPSDQTLDTGFLSAVMSVGLNCVYRAPILKFNPITPKTISRVWQSLWILPRQMRSEIYIEIWS